MFSLIFQDVFTHVNAAERIQGDINWRNRCVAVKLFPKLDQMLFGYFHLIFFFHLLIKMHIFRGDLTDFSAEKASLMRGQQ